jgi:hypothetical protein
VFGKAHALWQDDAETIKECGLGGIGVSDAAQADPSLCCGRQYDIVRLNAREFFEDCARGITQACALLPHLEALPQHESEEAHEDVGLDAILALMPDRAYVQLILLDSKRRFGLGELDIGFPELLITPIGDVRAQKIGALRESGPVIERGVVGDMESKAGRASICRMRPICRFTGAGSRRRFEWATRAANRSSAASIRRLNLSCIARSLLRRSAERHSITVSSVSRWRVSLTSTPSWTVRQPLAAASSEANFFSSDFGAPMM